MEGRCCHCGDESGITDWCAALRDHEHCRCWYEVSPPGCRFAELELERCRKAAAVESRVERIIQWAVTVAVMVACAALWWIWN